MRSEPRTRCTGVRASLAWSALLCAVMAARLAAQQLEPRSFAQRRVESYTFSSAVMGRKYDVSIGLPADYATQSDRKYPALFVTDGNAHFPVAFAIASGLAGQGTIEGVIVVSIDAPLEMGRDANTRRRIHEFSTDWPLEDTFGRRVRDLCVRLTLDPPQKECVGGAPKFLDAVVSELLPAISKRIRIDPERLGLFGHSAGGYFVSWVIFQANSPFTSYIIGSPAMAYGGGEVPRQEARYAESHRDLKVGVYMASGALELSDPTLGGAGQIVSGQAQLTAMLAGRKYPGLRLYSEVHPGLGHIDSAPMTLARGLRLLYAKQ